MTNDTNDVGWNVDLELQGIAIGLGLRPTPEAGEDRDAFASHLHYRVDELIRQRAADIRDRQILTLMDIHDRLQELVP